MNRYLLFAVFCMMAFCANAQTIELRYFHGKQRCVTCRNIEKCTQEVLAESYAQEVNDSKIKMRVIDFSTPEGKKVAAAHKVSFSALFLVKIGTDGKEQLTDLTRLGFQYAKNQPEVFKRLLKEKIDNL